MALTARLFFKGNRTYGIGNIKFDLELSEQHNFSNTVTEYTVEDGSIVSDHIQNDLENGGVTGLISNFSLSTPFVLTNKAQDVFEALVDLWKSKTLVKLVTVMRVYENVAIEYLNIARDEDTGEAMIFDISFRKVPVVKLQEVQVELAVKVNDLASNQNRQVAVKFDAGTTVPVA